MGSQVDTQHIGRPQQQKYYLLSNKFWDLTSRSNLSTWDATGSMWIVPSLNNKCMDSLTNRLRVKIEGHDLLEVENIFTVFNTQHSECFTTQYGEYLHSIHKLAVIWEVAPQVTSRRIITETLNSLGFSQYTNLIMKQTMYATRLADWWSSLAMDWQAKWQPGVMADSPALIPLVGNKSQLILIPM